MVRLCRASIICSLVAILGFASAQRPRGLRWSGQSYGPDGPWNAVLVKIGSSQQEVALYPGGWWETFVLLDDYCSNTTTSTVCYAEEAGLFDSEMSRTWDNTSILLGPSGYHWEDLVFSPTNAVPVSGIARRARETIELSGATVPNVDLISINQAYQTYPGGQRYPLSVGTLSLGAQDMNQTFDEIEATMVTSWLWNHSDIASYANGMHIGSAPLGISGSLFLGGYDKSRALRDISAQPHTGFAAKIHLLDISLGVAKGDSPWEYPRKDGLLAKANSSLDSGADVSANVVDPYIYLPQNSCDAIAAELPVTHNPDLGLYLWNTDDPQYKKIVTSPSYLAFTFVKDNTNTQNITIKVPFALLNLTLEAPLVNKPTPYFPCFGTEGSYALGRAFFQAAFIGINYGARMVGMRNWFLAQAPGPGHSQTSTVVIVENAAELTGSSDNWEATWAAHWSPLTESNSTSTDPTDQDSSGSKGLATGAKAGIGVGVGAAGLVAIALFAWWLARRRQPQSQVPLPNSNAQRSLMTSMADSQYSAPSERTGRGKQVLLSELDNNSAYQGPYEMGTGRS